MLCFFLEHSISSDTIRGLTHGMRIVATARAFIGGKILVVFYSEYHQPICVNAELFNNDNGFIVCNYGTFAYMEWRVVPPEVRVTL